MAVRTVSVELSAKVAGYVGPVEEAKKATEGLDDKINATDRDLKKLPPDAAKAAAALKAMGVESGHTALALEDADKRAGTTGTSMELLEKRLAGARGEVTRLAEEFNKTGSGDSLTKLFGAQDNVKDLEKLKTDLEKALNQGGSNGGKQAGESFASRFAESFSGLGEAFMPALIIAAAITAPMVGAIISAGVIAGIASGGIATGILGQMHDPQVQLAAQDLGQGIQTALTKDTAAFKQPIIAALDDIRRAVETVLGNIDFATLASELEPLARGLGGLIEELGPGINAAILSSKPVMDELAKMLPEIGYALSTMLKEMSSDSQGAAEGMRTLGLLIVGALTTIGALVGALTTLYRWFIDVADAATGLGHSLTSWIPGLDQAGGLLHKLFDEVKNGSPDVQVLGRSFEDTGSKAVGAASDVNQLLMQINATTNTVDTLAGAMTNKLFNSMMAIDQANLSVAKSSTDVYDALRKNKDALDIHSAAGQADREAILGAVSANMQLYNANINNGMAATDAANAYDANTAALERQMHKAGLTQQQIDGLIGKYAKVPDTVNTNIVLQGLTAAINGLNETLRLINGIHDKTVTITMRYNQVGTAQPRGSQPGFQRHGGIIQRSYAQGGISAAAGAGIYPDSLGPIVQFAEPGTGKEGYLPMQGISRGRAHGILAEEAGWYGYGLTDRGGMGGSWRGAPGGSGGGVAAVALQVSFGGAVGSPLGSLFMRMVRDGDISLSAGGVPVRVA